MSKVALVTGGTRGIGAAISLALKEAGYAVAATYAGNDTAAAEFKEATGIEVYKWDVGDFDACAEGVARVTQDLGEVAVLVNNAGITRDTGFSRMTKDMWDAVLDTNLTSNFNMCKATFDSMKAAKFGRIVCISSINGQKGQIGQVNYSAAKAGTIGFVKALAQEGARHGSPSMRLPPAISPPKWSKLCRKISWRRSSRASRWAVWARPRKSRTPWPIWCPTRRASSPARP